MNVKREYLFFCLVFICLSIAIPYSFVQAVAHLSANWTEISLTLAASAWIAAIAAALRWRPISRDRNGAPITPALRLLLVLLIVLPVAAASLILAFRLIVGGNGSTPGLH